MNSRSPISSQKRKYLPSVVKSFCDIREDFLPIECIFSLDILRDKELFSSALYFSTISFLRLVSLMNAAISLIKVTASLSSDLSQWSSSVLFSSSFSIKGYFRILWTGFIKMDSRLKHAMSILILSRPCARHFCVSAADSYFVRSVSALSWLRQYWVYTLFMAAECWRKLPATFTTPGIPESPPGCSDVRNCSETPITSDKLPNIYFTSMPLSSNCSGQSKLNA